LGPEFKRNSGGAIWVWSLRNRPCVERRRNTYLGIVGVEWFSSPAKQSRSVAVVSSSTVRITTLSLGLFQTSKWYPRQRTPTVVKSRFTIMAQWEMAGRASRCSHSGSHSCLRCDFLRVCFGFAMQVHARSCGWVRRQPRLAVGNQWLGNAQLSGCEREDGMFLGR